MSSFSLITILFSSVLLTLIWRLALNLKWRWAVPVGLLSASYLEVAQALAREVLMQTIGMSLNGQLFVVTFVAAAPLIILIGALTRRRALNSHGK